MNPIHREILNDSLPLISKESISDNTFRPAHTAETISCVQQKPNNLSLIETNGAWTWKETSPGCVGISAFVMLSTEDRPYGVHSHFYRREQWQYLLSQIIARLQRYLDEVDWINQCLSCIHAQKVDFVSQNDLKPSIRIDFTGVWLKYTLKAVNIDFADLAILIASIQSFLTGGIFHEFCYILR